MTYHTQEHLQIANATAVRRLPAGALARTWWADRLPAGFHRTEAQTRQLLPAEHRDAWRAYGAFEFGTVAEAHEREFSAFVCAFDVIPALRRVLAQLDVSIRYLDLLPDDIAFRSTSAEQSCRWAGVLWKASFPFGGLISVLQDETPCRKRPRGGATLKRYSAWRKDLGDMSNALTLFSYAVDREQEAQGDHLDDFRDARRRVDIGLRTLEAALAAT